MGRQNLDELFKPNESPYFAMFRAGVQGWSIEDVTHYLNEIGVPVRKKDIRNWQAGYADSHYKDSILDPIIPRQMTQAFKGKAFEMSSFDDLSKLPKDWVGTPNRWFPCTGDNKPMMKWGWRKDFNPGLYDYHTAKAMSPRMWVGQNMLYQNFIVMDIDGVGHGERDEQVIAFGNLYKDQTLCYENPVKPGSFHLYFYTDRLVPVMHFPYAKLDLMGNMVNAAVYMKDKKSNELPMMELDSRIWESLKQYVKFRKETR